MRVFFSRSDSDDDEEDFDELEDMAEQQEAEEVWLIRLNSIEI